MANEWFYIESAIKKDEQIRNLRRGLVFSDDDGFTLSDDVSIVLWRTTNKETSMTELRPDIDHPNYGALVSDRFDAGQVVMESVAVQMFKRQDSDYCLQYASAVWDDDACPSLYWDEATKQECGQHWRLVYRYYPRRNK